jgi:hypothetical protein
MRRTRSLHVLAPLATTVLLWTLTAAAWLRGAASRTEDRGSDSTEKTLMIILAIALGLIVAIAAKAFLNTKVAEFK